VAAIRSPSERLTGNIPTSHANLSDTTPTRSTALGVNRRNFRAPVLEGSSSSENILERSGRFGTRLDRHAAATGALDLSVGMAAAVARQTLWWRPLPTVAVAGPPQRRGIRLFRRRVPPAAAPAGFGAYDVIQGPSLPIGPAGVVPPSIPRPSYAAKGVPPPEPSAPILATPDQVRRLRKAGQLVRSALDYAATLVRVREREVAARQRQM